MIIEIDPSVFISDDKHEIDKMKKQEALKKGYEDLQNQLDNFQKRNEKIKKQSIAMKKRYDSLDKRLKISGYLDPGKSNSIDNLQETENIKITVEQAILRAKIMHADDEVSSLTRVMFEAKRNLEALLILSIISQ
jgi:FtsZ-binding cell division protein ZapB